MLVCCVILRALIGKRKEKRGGKNLVRHVGDLVLGIYGFSLDLQRSRGFVRCGFLRWPAVESLLQRAFEYLRHGISLC